MAQAIVLPQTRSAYFKMQARQPGYSSCAARGDGRSIQAIENAEKVRIPKCSAGIGMPPIGVQWVGVATVYNFSSWMPQQIGRNGI